MAEEAKATYIEPAFGAALQRVVRRDRPPHGGGPRGRRGRPDLVLWIFELTADMTTAGATAKIYWLGDNTDTGKNQTVLDPLEIFQTLNTGDKGLCIQTGNEFYVIQATCPA